MHIARGDLALSPDWTVHASLNPFTAEAWSDEVVYVTTGTVLEGPKVKVGLSVIGLRHIASVLGYELVPSKVSH